MNDRETINVYDARADEYARANKGADLSDPHLAAFIAACPSGGAVLDLGCGPGAAAAAMADAGLSVVATDASGEMVALAAHHPGVTAHRASFDEIVAQHAYDGIWANFSLLHAERTKFPELLKQLHHSLKPGGLFHIGMKLGTGEKRDALGRFYTYYSEGDLITELTRGGFTPAARHFGQDRGLDGTLADWIVVLSHG